MRFSESWLREWVNPPIDSEKLVEQLTMSGLEVDEVQPVAPFFSNVIVGEVKSVEPHPNADRLRYCKVDTQKTMLDIVCGASNVRPGLKVAVAVEGAVLPGDFHIQKSKIRGVESQGMLCSEKELGLIEQHAGIMELPSDAPVGEDLRHYLQLDDQIIDVDLTPNRGDCLSVAGIAREVGVINCLDVKGYPIHEIVPTLKDQLPISLLAPKECPRYVGRILRNLNSDAVTPMWMQEKLRRGGIRSIHPIVDICNYVMLEIGQPLHAFDLEMLQGGIKVRNAVQGESITLLDGQVVELDNKDVVIADAQEPHALAGVMGGAKSGVSKETKHIFLESAFFTPLSIRAMTQRHRLHSDSSHRFERGVDPQLQERGIHRATELILAIAGGDAGPFVLEQAKDFQLSLPRILLRPKRIQRILGISIKEDKVESILTRLGMVVERVSEGWEVVPPSYRFDVQREIDLIEEIARIYGYSEIPSQPLTAALRVLPFSESQLTKSSIRTTLVDRGYQEAITYSFVDNTLQELLTPGSDSIRLLNPIVSDMSVMRHNHWPGLIQILKFNLNRQQPRVRLFEIGLGFTREHDEIKQELRLGGLATGDVLPEQWDVTPREVDFYDIKSDIECLFSLTGYSSFIFKPSEVPSLHPGKSADIFFEDNRIGCLGALHPSLQQQLELDCAVYLFDINLESINQILIPRYRPVSKFPAIRRDIAMVIEQSIEAQDIQDKILETGGDLLKSVRIFDIYRGESIDLGQKSVAIGLIFQHASRTLVDAEINEMMQRIVMMLQKEFKATLRE